MNEAKGIGHRHSLPVDGLVDAEAIEPKRIRVFVSDQWAASRAGQHLTSCLVNLLCRQIKVVSDVEVIAQSTQSLVRQPYGQSSSPFPVSLVQISAWATNGAVIVTTTKSEAVADYTILVGDVPESSANIEGYCIRVIGDGWRAWVGAQDQLVRPARPSSDNPLGPFFAAALAAGEIFKHVRGILRGKYLSAHGYSLWNGDTSANWHSLQDGPVIADLALPPIHIVGGGAVGNTVAYVAANSNLAKSYFVLIDDDKYDDTNLNRCLVAGWSDRGDPKVNAIARLLNFNGMGAFPFDGTIKNYLSSARQGLRADVEKNLKDFEFGIVLSCVDKGASRQDIQGLQPKLLIGGSTLDLQAKSHRYSLRPGTACLGCFNPAERDGEKMRTLEMTLRIMSVEQRGSFLSENGLDRAAVEEYLSGAKCGGLGEAALRDFAIRAQTSFSAGFVSLGAGVLLFAELLRNVLRHPSSSELRDMITMNFLNGGMMYANLGADPRCERHCQERFA